MVVWWHQCRLQVHLLDGIFSGEGPIPIRRPCGFDDQMVLLETQPTSQSCTASDFAESLKWYIHPASHGCGDDADSGATSNNELQEAIEMQQ
jgi:hypothetical protein